MGSNKDTDHRETNQRYLIFLKMDEDTFRRANTYGQYADMVHEGTYSNGTWVTLWAWADNKATAKAFLESRSSAGCYYMKKVNFEDRVTERIHFDINHMRLSIFPAALSIEYNISGNAYALRDPINYDKLIADHEYDKKALSKMKKVWMTYREFDYIFTNSGEISETRIRNFVTGNADIIPNPIIFNDDIQKILIESGYVADTLTYHPEYNGIQGDEELMELHRVSIQHWMTTSRYQYSEYKLFLVTYRDIIY